MNKLQQLLFCITLTALFMACSNKKPADHQQHATAQAVTNNQIIGLAEIQPEKKIISLFAQTAGSVEQVYHDLNDTVKKGDLIISLNSKVEEAQLQQAQSKLSTQLAVINTTKAQLASISTKSDNAAQNYNRNAELIKSGAVTRQTLDDSHFAATSGTRDADAAAASVKQAQSRLTELQADVNYYQQLVDQKKIRAPYDGTILSMDMRVGNYITANQSVGDFAPAGQLMAVTEVDELYAQKVHEGLTAYIRTQGKRDTLAVGKVFLISPYLRKKSLFSDDAANMEDRRIREVRVLLDKGSRLLIGSRVDCVIQLN